MEEWCFVCSSAEPWGKGKIAGYKLHCLLKSCGTYEWKTHLTNGSGDLGIYPLGGSCKSFGTKRCTNFFQGDTCNLREVYAGFLKLWGESQVDPRYVPQLGLTLKQQLVKYANRALSEKDWKMDIFCLLCLLSLAGISAGGACVPVRKYFFAIFCVVIDRSPISFQS